jgi:hypothetical protein
MGSLRPRSVQSAALLGAACLLLCACGDPAPEPVPVTAPVTAPVAAAGGPATDFVAAVTLSGADAPVKLQFALRSKPQREQPLDLEVILQPTRDIDGAQVTFEPNESVEVASENPFFSIARTAAGAGVPHKLVLLPKRAGVLALGAVVTVDLPTGSVARSFSIPIIVFPAAAAN